MDCNRLSRRIVCRCVLPALLQAAAIYPIQAQVSEAVTGKRVTLAGSDRSLADDSMPRALISSILRRFRPEAATLEPLLNLLTALLNTRPVPKQVIIEQLMTHGVKERFAVEATEALAAVTRGVGDPVAKKELGDILATYAAASVTSDGAIATSTLVEFAKEKWALRVVTAVAVSNADTSGAAVPPGTSEELFKTRTADLLTLMQVGGSAVLRSHWNIGSPDSALFGAFTIDAGVMDDWLNLNTDSRYSIGAALQVRRTVGNAADPVSLILNGRAGYRWANDGIVTGDSEHPHLAFIQGSLEFALPGGKVPFGISFNLVDGPHQKYADGFHVYTSLRR